MLLQANRTVQPVVSLESRTVSVQSARVILLAGPSGSGKSYVAHQTGLPVLCLDDFYKEGSDPTLPRVNEMVDWESPFSWDLDAAMTAVTQLAQTGHTQVPVYDISRSARIGDRPFRLEGAPLFIAEGIFAAELVAACARAGVLADALALHRPRTVTFARRLVRDLAEHRKPPMVLVRRGLRLWREDPLVLGRQCELGCRPTTAAALQRRARLLVTAASRKPV
ncbi:uridine kinase family protein [Catellatospora paridis]|uniref:uridine kinase family protein n=1 Tax=Catellatospora paridis TaxID=1617086 RepID=UPI0012D4AE1E|nr:ATP-binding protein [Catellatospora paridis]